MTIILTNDRQTDLLDVVETKLLRLVVLRPGVRADGRADLLHDVDGLLCVGPPVVREVGLRSAEAFQRALEVEVEAVAVRPVDRVVIPLAAHAERRAARLSGEGVAAHENTQSMTTVFASVDTNHKRSCSRTSCPQ